MDTKVVRSIGFPLNMLVILDKYADMHKISRADVVRKACELFIKSKISTEE